MGKRKHGDGDSHGQDVQQPKKQKVVDEEVGKTAKKAIEQLPKASTKLEAIPPYNNLLTAADSFTPSLPVIQEPVLASTPFKHSSLLKQNIHGIGDPNESYERLEFLGDAYLELFATRLVFHRFAFHTPPFQVSALLQIRESLVSNETLSKLAKRYDFFDKLQILQKEQYLEQSEKTNKRLKKVLGDCFEAFVAAVTLDDTLGLQYAERWMAALWEDQLHSLARQHGLKDSRQLSRMSTNHQDQAVLAMEGSEATSTAAAIADGFHSKALEFLGGGYIEALATRIVYAHFEKLPPGRLSQITENLIKNDTLAHLAQESQLPAVTLIEQIDYKIPKDRIRALAGAHRSHIGREILRDQGRLAEIEDELLHSWAPILVQDIQADRTLSANDTAEGPTNPKMVYDSSAKALLQKRILGSSSVKLEYEKYQDSVELKGAQLGQNRHFIACYLTGYDYHRKLLGKGEGRSKAEAGNWAAMDAMYGDQKQVVEECAIRNTEDKERRKAEKLARDAT